MSDDSSKGQPAAQAVPGNTRQIGSQEAQARIDANVQITTLQISQQNAMRSLMQDQARKIREAAFADASAPSDAKGKKKKK